MNLKLRHLVAGQNGSMMAKYGLMDDVYALQPSTHHRGRPNADSDDDIIM